MKIEIKPITFDFEQLTIPPGNKVVLTNISWETFENILNNLGEGYSARLAYDDGILEIKMPLLGHEDDKEIIGDLVKALLEELNLDFRAAGSTTFKRPDVQKGVEPDQSFYIQNEPAIRGKREIDLTVDPPPDLAVEIDNTSKTRLDSYEALGVPELWIYDNQALKIYLLQEQKYIESNVSANFANFPVCSAIPHYLEQSKTLGRSAAIRAFRSWVREQF
jgi:Uma2 family endonuclease